MSSSTSSSSSRVTNLVLVTKKPGLLFDDFIAYVEDVHVPLMQRVFGDTLPNEFRRTYIDSSTAPFVGPYRGIDFIMEMGWEDQAGVGLFMVKSGEGDNTAVMQASWTHYCDEKGETVVGVSRTFGTF